MIKRSGPRYYRCPDCGRWHRHQNGGLAPCSAAMKQEAIDQIERLLAQAFGHGAEDAILKRAAERINVLAQNYGWGADLRERYTGNNHVLSAYIKADIEKMDWLRSALE